MQIRIPHFPKAEDARPLERCFEHACAQTGVDHYTAVIFMTHFLDQLVDENAKGHTVSIPGFGLFAPYLYEAKGPRPKTAGRQRLVTPRFSPSRGYRQQVQYGAPPKDLGRRKFRQHSKNNAPCGRGGDTSMRVFTAMDAIRKDVSAQIGHARD